MMPAASQPLQEAKGRYVRALVRVVLIAVFVVGVILVVSSDLVGTAGKSPRNRRRATEVTMRTVGTAIKSYKADKGTYPQDLQTLVTERYFDKFYHDAWKHELRYAVPGSQGKDYSLVSAGADGEFGTEDDIDVWRIDEE